MKPCIWYRTADQQPPESGYYLSYRGWGMGGKADGDSDWGYVYYDKRFDEWRDYESTSMGHDAIVYYWTDARPDQWAKNDVPVFKRKTKKQIETPEALTIAWQQVEEAIKRYETIKALTQ